MDGAKMEEYNDDVRSLLVNSEEKDDEYGDEPEIEESDDV